MTPLTAGLTTLTLCLLITCVVSIYFNIKHGLLILRTTELIEIALDLLDERHASINRVLEIPLFYDSPQIRQVLEDIERSRDAVLEVANYIAAVDAETQPAELSE
jgi:hypothetical protein